MVILLCSVFKNHGAERPLPADPRAKIILLMNATGGGVVLIHVVVPTVNQQTKFSVDQHGWWVWACAPDIGASPSPSLAAVEQREARAVQLERCFIEGGNAVSSVQGSPVHEAPP